MHIVIIDNYDSFTYNLVHYVEQFCDRVDVFRNDAVNCNQLVEYDKIILSPGPGLPSDYSILAETIHQYKETKPILGVCLGQQAIAEAFGGSLINLPEVVHGMQRSTIITDTTDYLFKGICNPFLSGRYHSWVIDPKTLPNEIKTIAIDNDSNIMAIRHTAYNIKGVQFHPESIMTPEGLKIIQNFMLH